MNYLEAITEYLPVCEQEEKDQEAMIKFIENNEDEVLHRRSSIAHLTSSGFIMNRDLTKALVIHHKIYDAWGWTGGHVDGDGDLLAVALKEAREETGLTQLEPLSEHILSLDILPVWGHEKKGTYVSAHLHLNASYVLIADEKEPLIQNVEETNGVKWIVADDIHLHSDEAVLVEVYQKLIKRARMQLKNQL